MPHIFLKREDLNHTGAHKINNSLGQALLCKRMTKKRIIAETGAGQHGVATVSEGWGLEADWVAVGVCVSEWVGCCCAAVQAHDQEASAQGSMAWRR